MQEHTRTRDYSTIVRDEAVRLSTLAARSADICLIAKAIAISDSSVQTLYVAKLTNPDYESKGVECLRADIVERYSYVVFRFSCATGAVCLVDPSFLVVVDNWSGKVDDIIDPYIPGRHVPPPTTRTGCPPTSRCSCAPPSTSTPLPCPCPTSRTVPSPCGRSILATREYFLGETGPVEETRYCFTHFQDERRDCWRKVYAEINYPNPDEIHSIVVECFQTAGIAALILAYTTGGPAIAIGVATFKEAFNLCMISRIGQSIGINVRDEKSCNDWDNH